MIITYPVKHSLYINLTNRCPCSCVFCIRNQGDGVYDSGSLWLEREPSVREIIDSVDANLAEDFTELVFCGYGEPTERLDDLLAVAAHVRATHPRIKIRINTNGLSDLINGRATAAELKDLIDTVSISLNTPDENEYERICRPKFGPRSWQALLDFASACRGIVPEVVLTVVGEPVTSKENQEKCRTIAESVGAALRVRRYEGS